MSIVIAKVRPPSRSHANETKFIELHKQTEHKLEVISKLYGGYLAVIAQAGKNGRLDASRIFIVEVCCGAGVHLSLENPNNEVPGTALLACHHARAVQRTFSDTHVSVRLIDSDRQACSKLALRAAEYCDRHLSHPEVVDVRIIDREFESQIRPILAETQASKGRYCSLWFIDPFGTKIIPRESLRLLLRAGRHVEIVINLDVRGIKRIRDAFYSPNTKPATRKGCRVNLDELYGDNRWDTEPSYETPDEVQMAELADLYASAVGVDFLYRTTKRLRASDAQVRYLVHLSHHPRGRTVFEESYNATVRPPRGSTALTITDRDKRVRWLSAKFAGRTTAFEEMVRLPECPMNRAQLKTVLRQAQDSGYGILDIETGIMNWNIECSKPPVLPLNPTLHTEKRSLRRVNERLFQPSLFGEFDFKK
jgi:three-Cys-motif partner protein